MTEYFPVAALVTLLLLGYTFFIRPKDIPQVAEPSPADHLEGRKAAVYENLRDLQFEYRVGKLSDSDYQQIKKDLQVQLATLLAEIDRLKAVPAGAPRKAETEGASKVCPHCNAKFEKPLRFCGECGKSMVKTA